MPLVLRPIAEQHKRALAIKSAVPVLVCLGNPPYDRHEADYENKGRTGGWVRWGDEGDPAILREFLDPALAAGHGVHLKNLYNLYVYFWRWALWKVFEHETATGPGVVSFISASSYLDGDAFSGMREHMRRQCDEIWILDLGGEGRGPRQDDNVFAIQTPVAIAVAFRSDRGQADLPARVHHASIKGTRAEKLTSLDAIRALAELEWEDCPDEWQAPFRPEGEGAYFHWPLLTDLMPWQQSGLKAGRTWVIAPREDVLVERWSALLRVEGDERRKLFKDSPTGRKAREPATQLPPSDARLKPIVDLGSGTPASEITRYSYRSFDRQFIFADARLLDRPGPALWRVHGEQQLYLTSLFSQALGEGPALSSSAHLPDLDHFRGSYGAKAVIPLYRAHDASQANIAPTLLQVLSSTYSRQVTPEDFVAYLYGVLGQPAFTKRFEKELETRTLCVPITKDNSLFERVRKAGAQLLWLHTYAERFVPATQTAGRVPPGAAKCVEAIPGYAEEFAYTHATQTLDISGGKFAPIAPDVYEFQVSGLKVVQSWLKYRMKRGAGRKSSSLDDIRPEHWTSQFTTELLELLWVLEATVNSYPKQERLLEAVLASDCLQADELPPVPEMMRKPPSTSPTNAELSLRLP